MLFSGDFGRVLVLDFACFAMDLFVVAAIFFATEGTEITEKRLLKREGGKGVRVKTKARSRAMKRLRRG